MEKELTIRADTTEHDIPIGTTCKIISTLWATAEYKVEYRGYHHYVAMEDTDQ
ncbi:hypothetical protein [Pectobacterium phage PcaP2EGY]